MQLPVLRELRFVGTHHDAESVVSPYGLIEVLNLPAERLGRAGTWCAQNSRPCFSIAEQRRLLGHHEMLRRRIALAVDDERRLVPLAEAGRCHFLLIGLVTPEENKLERLARVETRPQAFEVLCIVCQDSL